MSSGIYGWSEALLDSFGYLGQVVVGFLPSLLAAIVVFILGLIVAAGLGALVERIIAALKIDTVLMKAGLEPYLERAGLKLNASRFLGKVVYWFVFLVFLLAASDILGLATFSSFITQALGYIPQIVVAVLIMIAAVVLANFLRGLVKASVLSAELHAAKFLGGLTWWVVVIFGIFAALSQLKIGGIATVSEPIIQGTVAMLALAFGLAFGLGGKESAGRLLKRLEDQFEK